MPYTRRAPAGWRFGAHQRVAQALADRGAGAGTRPHHVDISAKVGDQTAVANLTEAGHRSAQRSPATIAQLIVDRKTNGEIAGALFLSKKTIETHIRNMIRNLDANSRVDIARAIEKSARLVG